MPSPHHRNPNEIPSALPAGYTRVHNYADWESLHPGEPPPGSYLNADFDAIEQAVAETQDRAALIQREDGNLKNGIVTQDALDPALAADLATLVSQEVADLIVALDAQVAAASASAAAAATAETNAELAETNAESAQTGAEAANTAVQAAAGTFSHVLARLDNPQSLPGNTSNRVRFDSEEYDSLSEFDVAATKGRFTATHTGFYHISATVTADPFAATAGEQFHISIHRNGDGFTLNGTFDTCVVTGTQQFSSHVSGDVYLTAGQSAEIRAYFNTGGGTPLDLGGVAPARANVSVHRLF